MSKEFSTVEVQGRPLRCNVCSNPTFWRQEVQLPTSLFAFLGIEEWNGVTDCAICERCGFIHWFVPPKAMANVPQEPQAQGT